MLVRYCNREPRSGLDHGRGGHVVPCRTGIINQDRQTISLLLDFGAKCIAASFVLEVCYNILALPRTKAVQSTARLLELSLFPACNDDPGTILNKGLGSHLSKTSSTACHQDYLDDISLASCLSIDEVFDAHMFLEVEEVGDG